MSERKTPKANEFWFPNIGNPYFCVAVNDEGSTVWQDRLGTFFVSSDDYYWKHWKHEPRCDCFGWVEPPAELWPKWYVPRDRAVQVYVKKTCSVKADFTSAEIGTISNVPVRLDDHHWIEVTEAEALARVTPSPEFCPMCGVHSVVPGTASCSECYKYAVEATGCPVESPDDWVELPQYHVLRKDIDEVKYLDGRWVDVAGLDGDTTENMQIRCRRKDLPVAVPSPPAELWPKWYVHCDTTIHWYMKRISDECVSCYYGGEGTQSLWRDYETRFVREGSWIEVTEAEALARLNPCEEADDVHPDDVPHQSLPGKKVGTAKITWVETADDWVIQDRVPARLFVDEYRVTEQGDSLLSQWTRCIHGSFPILDGYRHGKSVNCGLLELRCRRGDLPGEVPVESITADTDQKLSVMEMAQAFDKIATLVAPAFPEAKVTPRDGDCIHDLPIGSQNDWVEITDTHPNHIRRACDEVCGKTERPDDWVPVSKTVGYSQHAFPESRIRCLRRDVPEVVYDPKTFTSDWGPFEQKGDPVPVESPEDLVDGELARYADELSEVTTAIRDTKERQSTEIDQAEADETKKTCLITRWFLTVMIPSGAIRNVICNEAPEVYAKKHIDQNCTVLNWRTFLEWGVPE